MTKEEINIDEKIITPNEETTLRATLIEMRTTTTTRIIVRILTVQISITIINEIKATEIKLTIIITTIITTVNTDITYIHAVGEIIASKVTTNREAAAEA
jgi:hypothetical protein